MIYGFYHFDEYISSSFWKGGFSNSISQELSKVMKASYEEEVGSPSSTLN